MTKSERKMSYGRCAKFELLNFMCQTIQEASAETGFLEPAKVSWPSYGLISLEQAEVFLACFRAACTQANTWNMDAGKPAKEVLQ